MPEFIRSMPVLDVTNVETSVAFYEALGFTSHGIWDDPVTGFCIVQRGDVTFGLNGHHMGVATNGGWASYVYVADVEKTHNEFEKAGVKPSPLTGRKPYGCNEFEVRDPDGHILAFGQVLESETRPGLGDVE